MNMDGLPSMLDTGAMTRGSGSKNDDKERNIRKWFVDNDLIDGVILLPDNLFYNTTGRRRDHHFEQKKAGTSRKNKIILIERESTTSGKASPRTIFPKKTSGL
jgi:type I restriction enzyme M protein